MASKDVSTFAKKCLVYVWFRNQCPNSTCCFKGIGSVGNKIDIVVCKMISSRLKRSMYLVYFWPKCDISGFALNTLQIEALQEWNDFFCRSTNKKIIEINNGLLKVNNFINRGCTTNNNCVFSTPAVSTKQTTTLI